MAPLPDCRINDWQVAFEKAGFKNAIMGRDWPVDDSSMSLEDARFSAIRYFALILKMPTGLMNTTPAPAKYWKAILAGTTM